MGVPHKAAEAAVEGEDADDAKDKKSIAEVESLEEECDFCVYDDIRDKLIARGIPAEEIAYIHDAKTEQQKSDLFDKVRNGEIRVLLGSTAKMGTGTNVQKKLIAVHDLDIPWRPADVEHTKRNKGQPIIRQMALFPYTIINSLVMRILETTKEEILWSSVLLVICSINGNLPNRFIYLF